MNRRPYSDVMMLRKTFANEIPQLRDEIILLGSMVEELLVNSVDVLKKRPLEAAKTMIESDKRVALRSPATDNPVGTTPVLNPPSPRRVFLPEGARFEDFSDYQVNYLNYRSGWLIPSTEVWVGKELRMRINSLGCKGAELEPTRGVIAYFGDSTTFGANLDAWAFHVGVPGYQALNAGIEGHDLVRICARYRQLREKVEFDAVVVGGSWHNLVYNDHSERFWSGAFELLRSGDHFTALCTLPTAYNEACCARGLDDLIAGRAGGKPFSAWKSWPTTPEKTREAFEAVLRYNDFVRGYCARTGAALIDLFEVWRPTAYDDVADEFTDPVHARLDLYPRLGRRAYEALVSVLPSCATAPQIAASFDVPAESVAPRTGDEMLSKNVYPLW